MPQLKVVAGFGDAPLADDERLLAFRQRLADDRPFFECVFQHWILPYIVADMLHLREGEAPAEPRTKPARQEPRPPEDVISRWSVPVTSDRSRPLKAIC